MQTSRRSFLKAAFLASATCSTSRTPVWAAEDGAVEDGSVPGRVHESIQALCGEARLSMQFEGTTAEDCRRWQHQFRAKLTELLGDFSTPEKWTAEEIAREEFADHVRYELLLHAEGLPRLPVYLLMPTDASAASPAPGVLCVHGHGNNGHHPVVGRTDRDGVAEDITRCNYDYGLQFVRRGYVVAAPCMIPFGDRVDRSQYGGKDPCSVTFVRMMAFGKLPMAANLRDLRWALDLLQSRPEVIADRIGSAGLSYGGRMTMLVSAMDERIRVAAPSGAFNLLQERMALRHSCGSQIIPGLLNYGDYSEIGGLIAPRPCVWEIGSDDSLVTPRWADLFRERLERIYKALGKEDRLFFDNFQGGHQWHGEIAFPLFDKVLRG
jgi:dienelactone hydrolase